MDWKRRAEELDAFGVSWRGIARELDIPRSTVSDYLRARAKNMSEEAMTLAQYIGVKILFLDIETAPMRAHIWSMWQDGVGLNQIETDWFILSYSAKWAHSEDIYYDDLRGIVDTEDDTHLLAQLHGLLDEADIVIGHNVRKFDDRKIRARFILKGFTRPSPYRLIDTMEISKRNFAFTSNKLEYLTDKLCVHYKKLKHGKFAGHTLWVECLKDNIEAWDEMAEYNQYDVLSLEELYYILAAWDMKLPNLDVYVGGTDSDEWEPYGYHYTNLGQYQVYRHKSTGAWRRGRENLLSKEQRQTLLANIV